jgi:hypothetical protein
MHKYDVPGIVGGRKAVLENAGWVSLSRDELIQHEQRQLALEKGEWGINPEGTFAHLKDVCADQAACEMIATTLAEKAGFSSPRSSILRYREDDKIGLICVSPVFGEMQETYFDFEGRRPNKDLVKEVSASFSHALLLPELVGHVDLHGANVIVASWHDEQGKLRHGAYPIDYCILSVRGSYPVRQSWITCHHKYFKHDMAMVKHGVNAVSQLTTEDFHKAVRGAYDHCLIGKWDTELPSVNDFVWQLEKNQRNILNSQRVSAKSLHLAARDLFRRKDEPPTDLAARMPPPAIPIGTYALRAHRPEAFRSQGILAYG